jgi:hypothetical protein
MGLQAVRCDQNKAHDGEEAALRRLIAGYQTTYLVAIAAELGLADLLADAPRSLTSLAAATATRPDPLRRVLFALIQLGLLARAADGGYVLTHLGAVLRKDHPAGLAGFARYQAHPMIQQAWANLRHSLQHDAPAFSAVFGTGPFDYLAQHPEAAALFTAGMAARTADHLAAVVEAYDWRSTLIDIGGADGVLLAAILAARPATRGILFDQPRLREAAEARIAAAGLATRCSFVGGDFFATVPAGGDIYVLKLILHDWDDGQARAILRNIRRAMPMGARVIVIEPLLPEDDAPAYEAAMLDVAMLVFTGGRERTASAFATLYAEAGLRLVAVVPTASAMSLVVGEAV